jgi:hypothetical protein
MTPGDTTASSLIARVYWMIAGPLVLFLFAMTIVSRGNGWLTTTDFAFLALVAGLVLARWYEFQKGSPKTSTGEAATSADLRKYALGASVVGIAVWIFANLLGNHWLAG